jgi:methyl-accepting chemotaxis protein
MAAIKYKGRLSMTTSYALSQKIDHDDPLNKSSTAAQRGVTTRITVVFVCGFVMPPILWLFSMIFFGITNPQETISLALSPLLDAYVILYIIGIFWYIHHNLTIIDQYLKTPDKNALADIQNKIGRLPIFYMITIVIYCMIGPNTAMVFKGFLTSQEYILGWALGIPVILLFSLPFYMNVVSQLEKWTSPIPMLEKNYGLFSLNFKLALNMLVSMVGMIVLMAISSLAVANLRLYDTIIQKTLVSGAAGLLIAIIGYINIRGIVQPLDNLIDAAQAIGKGDINQQLVKTSRDEIGNLVQTFNDMTFHLRQLGKAADGISMRNLAQVVDVKSEKDVLGIAFSKMIAELTESIGGAKMVAEKVDVAASQLTLVGDQAARVTGQISATIQQIAVGINEQAISTNQTATSVALLEQAIAEVAQGAQKQSVAVGKASITTSQITSAIQRVTTSAQASVKGATQAADIARAGAMTVEETIRGMHTIQSKVDLSEQKVQEMGNRSEQIGAIVQTIDDIASQTNLLALNAAIEAARAGENGKGFAVVADEVRKLAEKSAAATKEIGILIKGIQNTVSEAVEAMNESAREVESGVNRANQSDKALKNILNAVEAVNGLVNEIVQGAQQIDSSARELVGAMDSVSSIVEDNTKSAGEMAASSSQVTKSVETIASVSEENSAAVEELGANAEEVNAQVEEVAASAKELSEMAQALFDVVMQFQLENASQG